MFKKLLGGIGAGSAPAGAAPAAPAYEPHAKSSAANEMYELLFCDILSAFQPRPGGLPVANALARQWIELARPLVARVGPWGKARLPPPVKPNFRITFVVSDGPYFGQGLFEAMERDALAGPLIRHAGRLLKLVVNANVRKPAP